MFGFQMVPDMGDNFMGIVITNGTIEFSFLAVFFNELI